MLFVRLRVLLIPEMKVAWRAGCSGHYLLQPHHRMSASTCPRPLEIASAERKVIAVCARRLQCGEITTTSTSSQLRAKTYQKHSEEAASIKQACVTSCFLYRDLTSDEQLGLSG